MLETATRSQSDPHAIAFTGASDAPTGNKRLHATPIKRILDRNSRELVGWLYEWNTGAHVPMWVDGRKSDVIYE